MAEFHRAAAVSEVSPGQSKLLSIAGKSIAVFHVDGKWFAIDNTCPHRQGPLNEGTLEGTIVSCPWHGWRFDLATGVCKMNPMVKADVFPTKVDGDFVWVEL
jgi:nitrite reductase (NADH) small subunit